MIVNTYSANAQTADSAATAKAVYCGVKSKAAMLGVKDSVAHRHCSAVVAGTTIVLLQSLIKGKSINKLQYLSRYVSNRYVL